MSTTRLSCRTKPRNCRPPSLNVPSLNGVVPPSAANTEATRRAGRIDIPSRATLVNLLLIRAPPLSPPTTRSLHTRYRPCTWDRIPGSDLPAVRENEVVDASTGAAVLVGVSDDGDGVPRLDRVLGPAHALQNGDRSTVEPAGHRGAPLHDRELDPDVRVRPLDLLDHAFVADGLARIERSERVMRMDRPRTHSEYAKETYRSD